MAPVKNGRLLFNKAPKEYHEPGKTTVYDKTETIDLDNVLLNGGFLVKIVYLPSDPYMWGRMRDPNAPGYSPPYTLGKPIDGFGIGVVLRSESPDLKAGDHIYGIFPFQQY